MPLVSKEETHHSLAEVPILVSYKPGYFPALYTAISLTEPYTGKIVGVMKPTRQPDVTTSSIVRLGFGAAVLAFGVHAVFAGLQGLLNVWVALTPGQDTQWNGSRSRA